MNEKRAKLRDHESRRDGDLNEAEAADATRGRFESGGSKLR